MKKTNTDKEAKIQELLERNVDAVIEKEHLAEALRSGKRLRIKLGIDPTGPKIHIGRAVVLWKLREFQDLGHKIVLIIGDMTAQIGDPSDKLGKRPFLTKEQIKKNLKDYLPQIGKIIDLKKVELRYNSEWLKKLNFRDVSDLAEVFTASQMLERRNFAERWEKHEDISLREFMYPLMQGYDSVAIKSDVELGGTDQLFNVLAGRKIQNAYGMKQQDVLTVKMLSGTDGRKMSTSWGNVVNVTDSPEEQFGKLMAMHDGTIIEYATLATSMSMSEVKGLEQELKRGVNPKEVKVKVARAIVARYYGEKKADQAAAKFNSLFSKKEITADVPVLNVLQGSTAVEIVIMSKVAKSNAEAWRLITQGGFKVNDVAETDPRKVLSLKSGDVVKIGKRHFFRIKA